MICLLFHNSNVGRRTFSACDNLNIYSTTIVFYILSTYLKGEKKLFNNHSFAELSRCLVPLAAFCRKNCISEEYF